VNPKARRSVDEFEVAKASNFNKSQQLSTSGVQQVQYQSVKNNKFQQVSIRIGIWFGTRGSEVQILSPRPIHSFQFQTAENRFENRLPGPIN
jgi:hypothetical protein